MEQNMEEVVVGERLGGDDIDDCEKEILEVEEDPGAPDAVNADESVEEELLDGDVEEPPVQENVFGEAEKFEESSDVKKVGFFKKVLMGLTKTRNNILSGVESLLTAFGKIDEEMFEELEEILIMADMGVTTSAEIINALRERIKQEKVVERPAVKVLLMEEITKILETGDDAFQLQKPAVVLVIGVNGVGKTTTIGKLAAKYQSEGRSVLLAAADTFRAAAIDQLEIWGQRSNIETIKHQENSDPGAVVFDAVQAARARKVDLLICDTAGRLHNKKNLMDELGKIYKIVAQNYPEAQKEALLVMDATTGQNALQQAKIFSEAANITGIVLTKLDGTAKGGIVVAIKNELKIPVRFIGVGEGVDDLQPFDAKAFAKALFSEEEE